MCNPSNVDYNLPQLVCFRQWLHAAHVDACRSNSFGSGRATGSRLPTMSASTLSLLAAWILLRFRRPPSWSSSGSRRAVQTYKFVMLCCCARTFSVLRTVLTVAGSAESSGGARGQRQGSSIPEHPARAAGGTALRLHYTGSSLCDLHRCPRRRHLQRYSRYSREPAARLSTRALCRHAMAAHVAIDLGLAICKPVGAGSALEAELLKAAATPFNLNTGSLLRFKASSVISNCIICPALHAPVEARPDL
jgi:hypothetical protein